MLKEIAKTGNPNCASDVGVGALCARAAVMGAFLNVKINLTSITDKDYKENILQKGSECEKLTNALEAEILQIVNSKIKV
jgi:glutamate formiminotransferase/formiminotetrahydrofolate cyclodeaminase